MKNLLAHALYCTLLESEKVADKQQELEELYLDKMPPSKVALLNYVPQEWILEHEGEIGSYWAEPKTPRQETAFSKDAL